MGKKQDQRSPDLIDDCANILIQQTKMFDQIQSQMSKECFSMAVRAAEKFSHKKIPKGEVIFDEGDEPSNFYIILSGSVSIFLPKPEDQLQKQYVFEKKLLKENENYNNKIQQLSDQLEESTQQEDLIKQRIEELSQFIEKNQRKLEQLLLPHEKEFISQTDNHSKYLKGHVSTFRKIIELQQGYHFGEIAIFTKENRSGTIVSNSETELITLGSNDFLDIFGAADKYINFSLHKMYTVLKNTSKAEIINFSYAFQQQKYKFRDIIYKEGDEADKIYLVQRGQIEISQKKQIKDQEKEKEKQFIENLDNILLNQKKIKNSNQEGIVKICMLGSGEFFGVQEVLKKKQLRKYQATCVTERVDILILEKNRLQDFQQNEIQNFLHQIAQKQEDFISQLVPKQQNAQLKVEKSNQQIIQKQKIKQLQSPRDLYNTQQFEMQHLYKQHEQIQLKPIIETKKVKKTKKDKQRLFQNNKNTIGKDNKYNLNDIKQIVKDKKLIQKYKTEEKYLTSQIPKKEQHQQKKQFDLKQNQKLTENMGNGLLDIQDLNLLQQGSSSNRNQVSQQKNHMAVTNQSTNHTSNSYRSLTDYIFDTELGPHISRFRHEQRMAKLQQQSSLIIDSIIEQSNLEENNNNQNASDEDDDNLIGDLSNTIQAITERQKINKQKSSSNIDNKVNNQNKEKIVENINLKKIKNDKKILNLQPFSHRNLQIYDTNRDQNKNSPLKIKSHRQLQYIDNQKQKQNEIVINILKPKNFLGDNPPSIKSISQQELESNHFYKDKYSSNPGLTPLKNRYQSQSQQFTSIQVKQNSISTNKNSTQLPSIQQLQKPTRNFKKNREYNHNKIIVNDKFSEQEKIQSKKYFGNNEIEDNYQFHSKHKLYTGMDQSSPLNSNYNRNNILNFETSSPLFSPQNNDENYFQKQAENQSNYHFNYNNMLSASPKNDQFNFNNYSILSKASQQGNKSIIHNNNIHNANNISVYSPQKISKLNQQNQSFNTPIHKLYQNSTNKQLNNMSAIINNNKNNNINNTKPAINFQQGYIQSIEENNFEISQSEIDQQLGNQSNNDNNKTQNLLKQVQNQLQIKQQKKQLSIQELAKLHQQSQKKLLLQKYKQNFNQKETKIWNNREFYKNQQNINIQKSLPNIKICPQNQIQQEKSDINENLQEQNKKIIFKNNKGQISQKYIPLKYSFDIKQNQSLFQTEKNNVSFNINNQNLPFKEPLKTKLSKKQEELLNLVNLQKRKEFYPNVLETAQKLQENIKTSPSETRYIKPNTKIEHQQRIIIQNQQEKIRMQQGPQKLTIDPNLIIQSFEQQVRVLSTGINKLEELKYNENEKNNQIDKVQYQKNDKDKKQNLNNNNISIINQKDNDDLQNQNNEDNMGNLNLKLKLNLDMSNQEKDDALIQQIQMAESISQQNTIGNNKNRERTINDLRLKLLKQNQRDIEEAENQEELKDNFDLNYDPQTPYYRVNSGQYINTDNQLQSPQTVPNNKYLNLNYSSGTNKNSQDEKTIQNFQQQMQFTQSQQLQQQQQQQLQHMMSQSMYSSSGSQNSKKRKKIFGESMFQPKTPKTPMQIDRENIRRSQIIHVNKLKKDNVLGFNQKIKN